MFLIDRPHVRGVSLSAKTKLNLRFRWLSEHEGSDREQKRLKSGIRFPSSTRNALSSQTGVKFAAIFANTSCECL